MLAFLCPAFSGVLSAETVSGLLYADNDFDFYVNGRLVSEDPIDFLPHNIVEVSFDVDYPAVYAIELRDFADPDTGLEHNNSRIGDGGFIAALSDGTVSGATWNCKKISWGPVDPSCTRNRDPYTCKVENIPHPKGWADIGFDDSGWNDTTIYTERQVRPTRSYYSYEWNGAEFIWAGDLDIDNTVLCRVVVER